MVASGESFQLIRQPSAPRELKKIKGAALSDAVPAAAAAAAAADDDALTFASCFDILAALSATEPASAPATTELRRALRGFEAQRPSWAAVAVDVASLSAVVQNAVGLP